MPVILILFLSPIADQKVVYELIKDLERTGATMLQPADFIVDCKDCKKNPSLLIKGNFLFIRTDGTENLVASFLRDAGIHHPIVFLSYEERNSLPAAMKFWVYVSKQNISA